MTPLAIAAVGLFVSFAALVVLLLAPDDEHRDARRRNQAHPRARR